MSEQGWVAPGGAGQEFLCPFLASAQPFVLPAGPAHQVIVDAPPLCVNGQVAVSRGRRQARDADDGPERTGRSARRAETPETRKTHVVWLITQRQLAERGAVSSSACGDSGTPDLTSWRRHMESKSSLLPRWPAVDGPPVERVVERQANGPGRRPGPRGAR